MFKSQTSNQAVALQKDEKSVLEILPKVEKIGMDLENKIYNLNQTKTNLFSLLLDTIEPLANDELKNNLHSLIFQIQTIDECVQSCLTTDDFQNLDNFIFRTKELLTQKNA